MSSGLIARLLAALALASLGLAPASAEEVRELIAPYLRARDEGALGGLAAEAHGLPRRAAEPPAPYDGVAVLVLPYSAQVDAELEKVKTELRNSLKDYGTSAHKVTAIRAAYERVLLAAGGGELIRGEVSDSKGMLRLSGVPAGDWLVLAWREVFHPQRAPRVKRPDASRFPDVPVALGHDVVSYWRARVSITAGETASIALTDRNVWMTAVRQETSVPESTSAGPRGR